MITNALLVTITIIALSLNKIRAGARYIRSNPQKIKTFLIFTGLIFFPILMVTCSFCFLSLASLSGNSPSPAVFLMSIVTSIALCGIIGFTNARDYLLYKKRCFGSMKEWLGEEKYSAARCKAMYPAIPEKYLSPIVHGICLGKTGFGRFKQFICIDPTDKDMANHISIVGTSSAGKSSGPILTSLIANFMNCDDVTPPPLTYLCIDPKPELNRLSTSNGKWSRTLNPKARRGTSYGWDLYYDLDDKSTLDEITDRIQSIVDVIVQDPNDKNAFFQESARNLLSGCLIYEYYVHRNRFIKSMHLILESELDTYVKKIKADKKCPRKVKALLAEFGKDDDQSNATNDIKKSLKQNTAVFTRTDTEWFLDTEVNQLMCSPRCLDDSISMFLSIKRADLKTFGVLFRLIIAQCSEHLSRREDYNPNDKPVVILVDEFTNLGGTLPNFAGDLGFIRSKKVTFITIFQQYSQLQKLYGKEEAKTILNMGHQLILSCEDTELGKIFSDKGGEFADSKTSYKRSGGLINIPTGDESVSPTSSKRIRVMDDLASLYPRFEAIAFLNGSKYVRFSKCRYYMEPELRARSAECVKYHELTDGGEV